jgi:hypothetical protein
MCFGHRLSTNSPTKRGKEKSPSDGHCQWWIIIYWRVNKFLKVSHIVTRLAKERASFLNIYDISFLGTPGCHHCCSIRYKKNICCLCCFGDNAWVVCMSTGCKSIGLLSQMCWSFNYILPSHKRKGEVLSF